MAIPAVPYNENNYLVDRFYNHAVLGLKRDLPGHTWEHEKYIERAGDALLWSTERFPKIVWEQLKDPRAVTITLTVVALLSNSFLFYPAITRAHAENVIRVVKEHLPFWTIKFAAYIYSCSTIIGYASRAYGRFSNEVLMDAFYKNEIR